MNDLEPYREVPRPLFFTHVKSYYWLPTIIFAFNIVVTFTCVGYIVATIFLDLQGVLPFGFLVLVNMVINLIRSYVDL